MKLHLKNLIAMKADLSRFRQGFLSCLIFGLLLVSRSAWGQPLVRPGPVYRGMCDASAAVAVGRNYLLVADDEDNILRLYRREQGGMPIASFDMQSFLKSDSKKPEADIEGAAWLDQRVFWITSHGRNKQGKQRLSRYRFFATEIVREGTRGVIRGVGRPYVKLLDDLITAPQLRKYDLAAAAERAPKEKGAFNLEGLAATKDGRLLIGFRNPIPNGKAILVPLENPHEIIKGRRARIGLPIELDLAGQGIRSIELDPQTNRYLIVAGEYRSGGTSHLYQWSGKPSQAPRKVENVDLKRWNPEALVVYSSKPEPHLLILSDDGTKEVDGTVCKALEDPRKKSFASLWLRLP